MYKILFSLYLLFLHFYLFHDLLLYVTVVLILTVYALQLLKRMRYLHPRQAPGKEHVRTDSVSGKYIQVRPHILTQLSNSM